MILAKDAAGALLALAEGGGGSGDAGAPGAPGAPPPGPPLSREELAPSALEHAHLTIARLESALAAMAARVAAGEAQRLDLRWQAALGAPPASPAQQAQAQAQAQAPGLRAAPPPHHQQYPVASFRFSHPPASPGPGPGAAWPAGGLPQRDSLARAALPFMAPAPAFGRSAHRGSLLPSPSRPAPMPQA